MDLAKKSYEDTAIRVCLDGKGSNCFQGSIHSTFWKEKRTFSDVTTFLLLIEQLTDERGFPEPMFRYRSLFPSSVVKEQKLLAQPVRGIEEIENQYGETETLRLYVTSRKHAGIQGHVVVLKTGNLYKFSSELELIHVIEEKILGNPVFCGNALCI